jgi:hypothetical protein
MNWREFKDLTTAMAEGHTVPGHAAINRALNKRGLAHTAYCWQRFSSACTTAAVRAPIQRPAAPLPWLPPLP